MTYFVLPHEPIVILGLGSISASGYGPVAVRERLNADGQMPFALSERMPPSHLEQRLGMILDFDVKHYLNMRGLRPLSRASQLVCVAVAAALRYPEPLSCEPGRCGIVLGTRWASLEPLVDFNREAITGGPHLVNPAQFPNVVVNAHAGYMGSLFGCAGPNVTVCGRTGGMQAIVHATDLLNLDRADHVLAVGVEALGATLLRGMIKAEYHDRCSFPGEAAGCLLLARYTPKAHIPLAFILAGVTAFASPNESASAKQEVVLDKILAAAESAAVKIDEVWSTGECTGWSNDPRLAKLPFYTLLPVTGDCEAANGPIAVVQAAHAAYEQARTALVLGFAPNGYQIALLVSGKQSF